MEWKFLKMNERNAQATIRDLREKGLSWQKMAKKMRAKKTTLYEWAKRRPELQDLFEKTEKEETGREEGQKLKDKIVQELENRIAQELKNRVAQEVENRMAQMNPGGGGGGVPPPPPPPTAPQSPNSPF
ncbi:MAG: hypothetical protein ACFFBD_18420 [Candidatus Hodarchaeota archaeon]